MDDGVVLDAPPTNRWALAGIVLSGLAAGGALFTVPLLLGVGLSVLPAVGVVASVEAAAALTCIFCIEHLHPADAEVERY